ncbi:MAG: tetratricopeptide repeat protein, partial [Polyangiales bacterium]
LFARHHGELAPDGAWFVELAEVRDRAALIGELATTLGVPPRGDVGEALSARGDVAVVLDDFENIVAHADVVADLVARAPRARFVITSREPLRLENEVRFELGALDEAVELFVDRARLAREEFEPDARDTEEIAALVQELDGLPLAIELAAARVRVLSPRQLREHLARRFDLLRREGEGRRSSLRGAIDGSWVLLKPHEQQALAQSSVFRGGFDLEAAMQVIALGEGAPWIVDVLQALEERSLLRVDRAPRFHLYESIREYAWEKLEGRGAAIERHARWFTTRARALADEADGPKAAAALSALALDRDNVVASQRRLLEGAPSRERATMALEATAALDVLLAMRGPSSLRLALLDAALAHQDTEPRARALALLRRAGARVDTGKPAGSEHDREEARLLAEPLGDPTVDGRIASSIGFGAWHRGAIEDSRVCFERATHAFETASAPVLAARARSYLANALYFLDRIDDARVAYRQAITALRAGGDLRALALAVANLASLEHDCGALAAARAGYEEALSIERELGMRSDEGIARMNLGHLALEEGNTDDARALYKEAVDIQREVGNERWQAIALGYLGVCDEMDGALPEARALYVRAIETHRAIGDALFAGLTTCWLARVHSRLGAVDEARAALDQGRAELSKAGAKLLALVADLCAAEVSEDVVARASEARSSDVRIALRMLTALRAPTSAFVIAASGRFVEGPDGER